MMKMKPTTKLTNRYSKITMLAHPQSVGSSSNYDDEEYRAPDDDNIKGDLSKYG